MIKQKSRKPVKVDVSLKYICPNTECESEHWLFLSESQTKNFKVVCECGVVFKPKQIDSIKIIYTKKKRNTKPAAPLVDETKDKISESLLSTCINVLVSYGYEKSEASDLINATYDKYKINDVKTLIKQSLVEVSAHG